MLKKSAMCELRMSMTEANLIDMNVSCEIQRHIQIYSIGIC